MATRCFVIQKEKHPAEAVKRGAFRFERARGGGLVADDRLWDSPFALAPDAGVTGLSVLGHQVMGGFVVCNSIRAARIANVLRAVVCVDGVRTLTGASHSQDTHLGFHCSSLLH